MKPRGIVQILCILALALVIPDANAQFGFGVKYQALNSEWKEILASEGHHFNHQMLGGSLYYWFRLKDKRIEFYPELSFMTTTGGNQESNYTTGLRTFGAYLNTDFYLFDLINDCDCPTFSKEGSFITRGFFLETTFGVDYENLDISSAQENSIYDTGAFAFRIGLGAGLDIGITDLVTLTPYGFFHWKTSSDWGELYSYVPIPETEIPAGGDHYWGAGLRIIFRPDYMRRFR